MVNLGTIQPPRNFLRLTLILAGASLVLVVVVLYFALSRGTVVLFPVEEDVSTEFSANLDASQEFDPSKLDQVPGRIETIEKEGSKDIDIKTEKPVPDFATVTVTIHNQQGGSQSLLPRTQLVNADGIKFRTDESVTVPGGGSVQVGATADQQGKEYNIEPSRFTIIKLSPQLQELVYAESSEPATGGERFEKAAIQGDIDDAQDALINELYSEAEDELQSKLSSDEQFVPEAVLKEVLDQSADVEPNTETDSYSVSAKVRVSTVVFDENNLLQLAIAQLKAAMPETKELVSYNPQSFNYEIASFDQKAGTATITAKLTGVARPRLSNELLDKEKIKGLSRQELSDHYGQFAEIERIEINLSPFWLTSLPTIVDHVDIELGRSPSAKEQAPIPDTAP